MIPTPNFEHSEYKWYFPKNPLNSNLQELTKACSSLAKKKKREKEREIRKLLLHQLTNTQRSCWKRMELPLATSKFTLLVKLSKYSDKFPHSHLRIPDVADYPKCSNNGLKLISLYHGSPKPLLKGMNYLMPNPPLIIEHLTMPQFTKW